MVPINVVIGMGLHPVVGARAIHALPQNHVDHPKGGGGNNDRGRDSSVGRNAGTFGTVVEHDQRVGFQVASRTIILLPTDVKCRGRTSWLP